MIAMAGRRAFGAKPDHDRRLRSPQKRDDVANELCWLELMEGPVCVAGKLDRLDPENTRRIAKLVPTNSRELLSRRHGDAGSLSGVPVRCAKQISCDPLGAVLGDSPAGAK